MKKVLFIFLISLYLNIPALPAGRFISNSYAITVKPSPSPAPTSKPTPNIIEQQINSLTNKIASRVAQLKLVEKRGVIGQVTDSSNTQITLSDIHGNIQFIDVDEFTKFTSITSKTSFGISDITKGNKLGVLGLYNKESRRILARFVDVLILPQVLHGAVVEMDSRNFTLSITTEGGKKYSVDIQSSTKTVSYNLEKKALVKSGFSKIENGQSIIVIGFPDKKDAKLFEASRVIVLPDVAKNPKIKLPVQTTALSPTPISPKKSAP